MIPVKNKKVILSLVIVLCLISSLSIILYPSNSKNQPKLNDSKNCFQKLDDATTELKTSKISAPIHIDNNWSDAQSAGLCTGSGTYSNPYVIKELEIDGGELTNCIFIENSQEYFKIENCTLYNAGDGSYSNPIAGIRLNNTQNGIIKNNTCYLNNEEGIAITYSENLTVLDNNIHDNERRGLFVGNSNNISIDSNIFDFNHLLGIVFDNSADIIVSNNTMIDNSIINTFYGGINIGDDSTNFTVSDNIFINNNLEISEAYYSDISNNTFINGYIDFYGNYNYLATLNIDIKNRINGQPIYLYKDKVGLGFNNFTHTGIPGQVILSNCNNSIINKLNFSEGLAGIFLYNSNNIKIVECNLTDNIEGILLASVFNITVIKNILANNEGITLWQSCHNNTFYNNTILNTDDGIEFHGKSNYNNITNNRINYNERGGIIFEDWSDYNWIINNTLIENEYGIKIMGKENVLKKNKMRDCGLQIVSPSRNSAGSHIIEPSNKINNKTIYYYANKQYLNTINFTKAGDAGQIILANCNNSIIIDLSISDSSIGLSLVYCENNTIKGNTFSRNKVSGLNLLYSSNNSIYDNDLVNNYYGLILEDNSNFNNISNNRLNSNGVTGIDFYKDCHNNTILDNLIRDNGGKGICLHTGCENNTLSHNTIIYNSRGIQLSSAHNNLISFNNIKNNEGHGIQLLNSNKTLILGNKIHFNGYGYFYWPYIGKIYYNGYGVYLDESNNNKVTENEFLGNKNNIGEEDSRDNKIYNNYFLTLPPNDGGDNNDDDDDDGSHEYDLITILIFLIIIFSVCAIAATSLYYYNHKNKTIKSIRKIRAQDSNKMMVSSLSSKEILEGLTDKSLLLQIFQIKESKKISDSLDNINLTAISNEFLMKLDSIKIEEEEKIEFLREMLLFSPEERNEILDNILKRLNSYSEGE
ncbi:MAG: hypothetical protein EU535_07645 [Promethearchaeota archaeon]|nr:MAG: hypothetical protein EU535_07645 [Candidatus Lokiarchaeota archaeon]